MCAELTKYQALLEALFMYLTSEPNEGHTTDEQTDLQRG